MRIFYKESKSGGVFYGDNEVPKSTIFFFLCTYELVRTRELSCVEKIVFSCTQDN